jgi:predicted ArsR family transcriptional regulator
MYGLNAAGWETFPRDYALLLSALMRRVATVHGREALLRHLEGIAQELGGALATEHDMDKRLRRLLKLYNDLGFEADVKREGRDIVLTQRNCPFLKTARDDPDALCKCLDEGIMRAAVPEALVSLRQTLARGDGLCRHEIRLKSTPGKRATA